MTKMRNPTAILLLFFLAGATSALAQSGEPASDALLLDAKQLLLIEMAQDSMPARTTRAQLFRLLATHDLEPWLFTRHVVIDEDTHIPHSHPVLTLSTRHVMDDDLLLSTLVHEQLHWYLGAHEEAVEAALTELRERFPDGPVGGGEGGRDERSTYTHLVVCYLEKVAVRDLLGELRAKQVMDFWAKDHYTWIYDQVIQQGWPIYEILKKHDLLYPPSD